MLIFLCPRFYVNRPQNGNHYKVALLQADGLYQLESTTQRGDGNDVWYLGGKNVLGPNTVPNTNAYQRGVVKNTGITITVTSPPGPQMSFTVEFGSTTVPSTTSTSTVAATPQATPGTGVKKLAIQSLLLKQPKASTTSTALRGVAEVRVIDKQTGKSVSKAKVNGRFYRSGSTPMATYNAIGTTSGSKSRLGLASLRTTATWPTLDQNLWFCITNVQLTGYSYDATANTVTCISAKGDKRKGLVFGTQYRW